MAFFSSSLIMHMENIKNEVPLYAAGFALDSFQVSRSGDVNQSNLYSFYMG